MVLIYCMRYDHLNNWCILVLILVTPPPQDELLVVFRDKFPAADIHLLVIPKAKIANVNELTPNHIPLRTIWHLACLCNLLNLTILACIK